MAILVTGAAGFIGYHVCEALLARGDTVIGIDCLDDYYPVALKRARLDRLTRSKAFSFHRVDLAEEDALASALSAERLDGVIHLAAQAGVRYSLENPMAYARSNLIGHLIILEYCRRNDTLNHLVYASTSSVYGLTEKVPSKESDPTDAPISLYAATKKSDELMSHAYAHLYGIPQTGLRFFTVYGPWGRPDMAYWKFTEAIYANRPIDVYNNGDMRRDFTYIDDIVGGVLAAYDGPPARDEAPPHRVYNIGNNRTEELTHFIDVLEKAIGKKAERRLLPMQPGDVYATGADVTAIERDHGFRPQTPIEEGLPKFVEWYRWYHGINA